MVCSDRQASIVILHGQTLLLTGGAFGFGGLILGGTVRLAIERTPCTKNKNEHISCQAEGLETKCTILEGLEIERTGS